MKIGVVGGGQLGRMMGLAGIPLGLEFRFLDPSPAAPAAAVGELIVGELNDPVALAALTEGIDHLTYEIENIDVQPLQKLTPAPLPPIASLAAAQDRRQEKQLFAALEIPAANYAVIESEHDLTNAATHVGFPAVLKANRMGYDGRGQRFVNNLSELTGAWQNLATDGALLESLIPFDSEVSMIGVRNRDGDQRYYPLTENHHDNGILRLSRAPAAATKLEQQARRHVAAIMAELEHVGILTVEFFQQGDLLLANEMAPRVHNSGHWTIEGAVTSQFENHLRAICDLPLGSTDAVGFAAMVNLIGAVPPAELLLTHPHLHLHDYGKTPRENRKVGHCTLVDTASERLNSRLEKLQRQLREQP
jgi:5-(carboxyamino)imidazole ribonucleotide synthase